MMKYAGSAVLSAVLAAATAGVAASRPAQSGLAVHEWGTFTSVAGPDGQSVNWTPLSGPQDLPCFVAHQTPAQANPLTNIQVKGRDIFGLLKLLPDSKSPAVTAAPIASPAPAGPPPPA